MTVGLKFFQITRIKHWMNETFLAIFNKRHVTAHTGKEEASISQFQALSTALAATIGVGNIAGVAGAMYYLQDGVKSKKGIGILAKPLAILFSLFCVFASFGIGNMTQVHEIASTPI